MTVTYKKFDILLEQNIELQNIAWPAPGDAMDEGSLGCNRSYMDLRGLRWSNAQNVFAVEGSAIQRILRSPTPEEEHEVMENELFENGEIFGLDIGVASTVIALSAARCVPFSSCNGGAFGGSHYEAHPVVGFFARPEMAELLLQCARESGAGLTDGFLGALVVYADDISKMRLFADEVIRRRAFFRRLRFFTGRAPRWTRSHYLHKQMELFRNPSD